MADAGSSAFDALERLAEARAVLRVRPGPPQVTGSTAPAHTRLGNKSQHFACIPKHNSAQPFGPVSDRHRVSPSNQPIMTAQNLLDEMACIRQRRSLYIARLSPEQAQRLARQDMQAHSRQTRQFERAELFKEMTMRASVNPHYKAVIDQATLARLAAALQQSRASSTDSRESCESQSAIGLKEPCT